MNMAKKMTQSEAAAKAMGVAIAGARRKPPMWPIGLRKTVRMGEQPIATSLHHKGDVDPIVAAKRLDVPEDDRARYKSGTPNPYIGEIMRKDENGKLVTLVPVFQGIDASLAREVRYQMQRFISGRRMSSKFWEKALGQNKGMVARRRMAQIAEKLPFGKKEH